MKKTAILLMIIAVFSKTLGFTRDVILSYFYGASNISDAYLISASIPIAIFTFAGISLSTGYIPTYSHINQYYGEEECNRYTNILVNIVIIICTIIVILGFIFTEQIVWLFASGFEGQTLNLAINFTRKSIFGIYFSGLIYIFCGFLQVKDNFTIPALVGIPLNIFIIISIFLSVKTNVIALPIGIVLANASQLLFLIPFIHKKGYRYRLVVDVKDKNIIHMGYMILPIILGVSVEQINYLVDKSLASRISVGGISALNYSNKLNGFVQGLFVTTISTVIYPVISKMAVGNNINEFKKTIAESINIISLLVMPATVGTIIFAEPIVKLLFGRGAFDIKGIQMTSSALLFYSIGMIGFGFRDILSRGFYSLQDTKTPMKNGTFAMIMNLILNLMLSKPMGIGGLALATSLSNIFCTILLFISFRKKIGPFGMKNAIISFMKILFASLMMGVVAKLINVILLNSIGDKLALLASVCIGAIIYFIIIYIMKIDEVNRMVSIIKKVKYKLE